MNWKRTHRAKLEARELVELLTLATDAQQREDAGAYYHLTRAHDVFEKVAEMLDYEPPARKAVSS